MSVTSNSLTIDFDTPDVLSPTLPPELKDQGSRVDPIDTHFDRFIEQHGIRVALSRAAVCPCVAASPDLDRPDPNCEFCSNRRPGVRYYRPSTYAVDEDDGVLDPIQLSIVNDALTPGVVMSALATSIMNNDNPHHELGNVLDGSIAITFRKDILCLNLDRITILDHYDIFTEVREIAEDGTVETRYPVCRLDFIRSHDEDLMSSTLITDGVVTVDPVPTNTRVSLSYIYHPVFVVKSRPHVFRATKTKYQNPAPRIPLGDPQPLPRQYMCALEYLI